MNLTALPIQCHLWHDYGFSKRAALHAIVSLRMSMANARGKGNKAFKRAAMIETAQWFDHHCRLSEADIDTLALTHEL